MLSHIEARFGTEHATVHRTLHHSIAVHLVIHNISHHNNTHLAVHYPSSLPVWGLPGCSDPMATWPRLLEASDKLSALLRQLKGMPLPVVAVHPMSPGKLAVGTLLTSLLSSAGDSLAYGSEASLTATSRECTGCPLGMPGEGEGLVYPWPHGSSCLQTRGRPVHIHN